MAEPLISVVMPVKNVAPFVGASIQSILEQSLADFEFVILDDASTDDTPDIVADWARRDTRIRFCRSKQDLGLRGSSNEVVRLSRAAVIARMDGDDRSLPDRLRRQWEVLMKHDDAVLVGTLSTGVDAKDRLVRPRDRWRLVRKSDFAPFPHGSIMYRRQVFDDVGGYARSGAGWEDQELFVRLASRGTVYVIPDVLYHYRYHVNSASLNYSGADRHSLYATGALRLWAGHSPRVLKQLLTQRALRLNPESIRILIWASWGEVNPASLRAALRALIRTRDFLASAMLRNGRPCEWRFEQS